MKRLLIILLLIPVLIFGQSHTSIWVRNLNLIYPLNATDSLMVGYNTSQGYRFAVNGSGYFNGNLKATTYGTALVTDTELGYVDGVTSSIQSQLNAKIGTSAVTYENLNANGDVGQVASTVAAGDDSRFHSAITLSASSTTGGLSLSTQEISFQSATTSQNGYLTSTDWNTFNNKLSGNQTITLSGDISGSGTTSITTTIGSDKILESMLKSVNAPTDEYVLTYESTTGDFEWQESTVADGDKGDVVVSSSGAAWNLDNNFISTKPPSVGNAVLTGDSIIIERSGVLYSSSVDEVRSFVQLNIADDVAYSSAWDSDGDATSKNTLYDKFEDLKDTGIPRSYNTVTTAFNFTSATVNIFNASSNQTWYLPSLSSSEDGVEYVISNISLFDLNIKPAGSDEISGFDNTERQIKLLNPGECCTVKKVSSTQWAIISLFGQFN